MQTRRAQAALLTILVLLLAAVVACSGDDDDDADDGSSDAPTTTEAASNDDSGDSDDGDDASSDDAMDDLDEIDFGDGLVVVTIGEERFEFDLNDGFNACRDVFGGLQFGGAGTDGRDSQLTGWIPPADWESYDDGRYDPPAIEVENKETNQQWIADAARAEESGIPAGSSQVDSFEIDGLRASGTATFIDTFSLEDPAPVVQGTFEIACTE